ncbi:ABC transporter ATP-binding protein/permease [Stella sp.]|uniref:ABC transporter ATP-binding protein/permease n=1 Tax=Stella sp. TaxID=2912054 RepID=UPI0035B28ECD
MTGPAPADQPARAPAPPPAGVPMGRTLGRFARFGAGYWAGPGGWAAWGLTIALVVLTIVQVLLAVRLNLWNADLFDALERRDGGQVLVQSLVFAGIVVGTMIVNVAHLEVRRRLQIGWRAWLTRRVADAWMDRGRQHQLSLLPGAPTNPDARIAEDIRLVAEAVLDLAHSLFYCLLLLVGFVSILWVLSGTVTVVMTGVAVDLPGYLVWLALLYSGIGVFVAFLLGRPLVQATDQRQTAEANFRFGLVRDREEAEAIALLAGEPDERRRLARLFDAIALSWRLQTAGLRSLTLFSSAYGTLATVFPILVAAPRYLAAEMTLGGLMQTAQAFQQVTAALSWPIDNFPRLAETVASMERVLLLMGTLDGIAREAREPGLAIEVVATSGSALTFRDLTIADVGGRTLFSGISTEVAPGEHVLILGDPRLARTLFKVVARVWPWGRGRVELPDDATIHVLPAALHLPADTLRAILSYPDAPDRFDERACAAALARVGLAALVPRLAEAADWMRTLDASERQRIGFARLLLQRPSWIFLEEPGEALDTETERALIEVLLADLPGVTLLTASHHADLESIYGRTLRLEPAADGRVFVRDSGPHPPSEAVPRWRAIERIRRGFGEAE